MRTLGLMQPRIRRAAAATDALRDAGFAEATLWTAAENHGPRRINEVAG
jgi:hypothetical protein